MFMATASLRPGVYCRPLVLVVLLAATGQTQTYLGLDRNDYPGDTNLTVLRKTFSYAGYWLNNPPGSRTNSWAGKRQELQSAGFGFLLLFNGRLYKELKHNAAATGEADGRAAASTARREGFPSRTIIFLDIEEGGRMLPEQKAYIYAWVDAVRAAGFGAGFVDCSEGGGRRAGDAGAHYVGSGIRCPRRRMESESRAETRCANYRRAARHRRNDRQWPAAEFIGG